MWQALFLRTPLHIQMKFVFPCSGSTPSSAIETIMILLSIKATTLHLICQLSGDNLQHIFLLHDALVVLPNTLSQLFFLSLCFRQFTLDLHYFSSTLDELIFNRLSRIIETIANYSPMHPCPPLPPMLHPTLSQTTPPCIHVPPTSHASSHPFPFSPEVEY